jgi:hypothetical protein
MNEAAAMREYGDALIRAVINRRWDLFVVPSLAPASTESSPAPKSSQKRPEPNQLG